MSDWPILTMITFLPLLGALLIMLVPMENPLASRNIKNVALFTTTFTFLASLYIWVNFDATTSDFQFVERYEWIGNFMAYHMGVDGISMLFVILTAFLMPFCILASWESVQKNVKEYMIAFLMLETFLIGLFSALDLVLFYIFLEAALIPLFLIIGIWGGEDRVNASFRFFLYTLVGSLVMLVAIMAMYWQAGTSDIPELLAYEFPADMQFWLWLAFFAAFVIFMPMWPFHTWLSKTHVEAPIAGSIILAGVVLKLGGYGFLRFSLPMFPVASAELSNMMFGLSVIAIVYCSMVALVQEDIKKLIAYASVAQMGFVSLGIFTATEYGVQGALHQMFSHALIASGLFLCAGVLHERLNSWEIGAYSGLLNRMPNYAVVFFIFVLGSLGLPGTSGFVGEFLTLFAAFQVNTLVAVIAVLGVVLSASYSLVIYRHMIFGPLEKESLRSIIDLTRRERLIIYPLAVLVIIFGLFPMPIFTVTDASVDALLRDYRSSIEAARETSLSGLQD